MYGRLMHDAQTPQQALDLAAATTRQAHDAAAVPRWRPIVAGLSAGITMMLLLTAMEDGLSILLTSVLVIAGIATGFVCYRVTRWIRETRSARGIVPRQPSEWTREIVTTVVILVVPFFAVEGSRFELWLRLLSGVLLSGWVWYDLARPRTDRWTKRLRTAPWKN